MATPIRGRTRPLPVKAGIIPAVIPPEVLTLDANLNASIHNRFDVEVIDAKTGKVRQRAHGENVICSQLWTRLFTPQTYFNYIHYGTGAGTPAANDTALFTFLGYGTPSTADDAYISDVSTGVCSLRRKIQLSETTAVGSTITELGIGYSTTAATLCTHAMLKDANGNQISIAKTSTDIINIYATVFIRLPSIATMISSGIYKPIVSSGNNASIDSIIYWIFGMGYSAVTPYTIACRGVVYYNASLSYKDNTKAYNASAKTLTVAMGRAAIGQFNISHGFTNLLIGSDKYGRAAAYDLSLSSLSGGWYTPPAITGEAIGTGDGSTVNFTTAFECISGTPTVYVDGVADGNVTVDINKPYLVSDMGQYFICLQKPSIGYSIPNPVGGSPYLGTTIWYNPFYNQGISSFYAYNLCQVDVSDDLVTWVTLHATGPSSDDSKTVMVDAAYQKYRYWRIIGTVDVESSANGATSFKNATYTTAANIHFPAAPASGAVITMDYAPKCIAKDTNHVFDLFVTIALGEYTT